MAPTVRKHKQPVSRAAGSSRSATLFQVDASRAINATLYTNLNFNFIRDITPVIGVMGYRV
jgi:hypothetical protein